VKPFTLVSHAVRAKEIISVVARHGFVDLINQIDLPAGLRLRFIDKTQSERTTWERVRLALEDLGPTFVKFGQLMSMRPDALPAALILELRKLQSNVRPVPFAEISPVLIEEFKGSIETHFSEFNETPVASASLAQVYYARLKSDGKSVAVKVQRPNIAKRIGVDLELATWFIGQLHNRVDALKGYDLPGVMAEVKEGVLRELDFENEARNQRYFNTLNPYSENIYAPVVYTEFSGPRVIVMERIDGHFVDSTEIDLETKRKVAAAGARSLMHQILITGFFHADPHAGNVLITAEGKLCFLDWGLAGHLTRRLRYALADFWVAAVDQDAEEIVNIASRLAPPEARLNQRVMEKEVTLALREELNFSIGRQQLGRAMLKLLFIFGRQGIPLSRDYCLMAKAVLAIEEIGRSLDPSFDIREQAAPILKELYQERNGPTTLLKHAKDFTKSTLASLQELPDQIQRLMRRLEHDNLTLNLQHHGLEQLDSGIRSASNRIALGVIIGSLIIGSSLIVNSHQPPFIYGYPLLGITGYLISAALGFYVIWDIIRTGSHK
jgi:ubiquinone biosynthesis protein